MFQGDVVGKDELKLVNAFKQFLFWAVHVACLAVFWTSFSWFGVFVCFALYFVRMFAITGVFHRYFSHRTYDTSRFFQFILAFLGTMSGQKGPIWWASHHRHHHQHSDTPEDAHSPAIHGIYYAHVGWILSSQFVNTRNELVTDLLKFPELRWLDKYYLVPPVMLAVGLFFLGTFLETAAPVLHTDGMQLLMWGFFVSTVLLYHGTFCINSFCHLIGNRRFKTTDDSRNSLLLALITLGEGWHNNHHRYPGSERQGMYWWELDISHYIIKTFEKLGLVWNVRMHPKRIYDEAARGIPKTA
jgi:stearoyl-CoA desaturase (delta-9 desaturase)